MTEWRADPQRGVWLVPSRGRPKNAARFMAALEASGCSTPGWLITQQDDTPNYQDMVLHPKWRIMSMRSDSQGDKLRELWDQFRDCEWVGLLGDDQVPTTMHWDTRLISELRGWNLVSCNDDWAIRGDALHQYERIAGTILMSGPLLRAVGYLFPPGMNHTCLDDVYESLDMAEPIRTTVRDVTIQHVHFANTPGLGMDETYTKGYVHYGPVDQGLYYNWRDCGEMDRAAGRVRALKEQLK